MAACATCSVAFKGWFSSAPSFRCNGTCGNNLCGNCSNPGVYTGLRFCGTCLAARRAADAQAASTRAAQAEAERLARVERDRVAAEAAAAREALERYRRDMALRPDAHQIWSLVTQKTGRKPAKNIMVIGHAKSGKSSFINTVFRVLFKDWFSYFAGVTQAGSRAFASAARPAGPLTSGDRCEGWNGTTVCVSKPGGEDASSWSLRFIDTPHVPDRTSEMRESAKAVFHKIMDGVKTTVTLAQLLGEEDGDVDMGAARCSSPALSYAGGGGGGHGSVKAEPEDDVYDLENKADAVIMTVNCSKDELYDRGYLTAVGSLSEFLHRACNKRGIPFIVIGTHSDQIGPAPQPAVPGGPGSGPALPVAAAAAAAPPGGAGVVVTKDMISTYLSRVCGPDGVILFHNYKTGDDPRRPDVDDAAMYACYQMHTLLYRGGYK